MNITPVSNPYANVFHLEKMSWYLAQKRLTEKKPEIQRLSVLKKKLRNQPNQVFRIPSFGCIFWISFDQLI